MKVVHFIIAHLGWFVMGLLPLYAVTYVIYFAISLPLRRQERTRLFFDLLETGAQSGRGIEQTIVSISKSRDRSVGIRFHLLAAYLETGWGLIPALEKVGGLLPPPFVAMLRVGQEIGDIRKVLPACRTLIRDATAQIQSAYNYLVVLAFVLVPIIPALFWMMTVFVIPRYEQIFADLLEGAPLPSLPFAVATILSQLQIILGLLFYVGAIFYVGGPRFIAWLQAGLSIPNLDWILWIIPWRRKRMQRDFAAMLGTLLDAGVPEQRSVLLAAESTVNQAFIGRARKVVDRLGQGVPLTEAVGQLDDSGEFHWRLANAAHAGNHFFSALRGWLETLDAKAFQQQQAFAQGLTTVLVLYNGAMVGLFTIFVFRGITAVILEGVLW